MEFVMLDKYKEILMSVALFDSMQFDEIKHALSCLKSYIVNYKKGEYIYYQHDKFNNIGIIVSGTAAILKEYPDGSVQMIEILKQGDTFGEDVICSGQNNAPYSVISKSETTIIYLDGKRLIDKKSTECRYRSHINLNMLKRIAQYSMYVNKKMEYLNIYSLKKRVGTFILDCFKEQNTKYFTLGMNREQMSDYLNGTRPAVSKILMYYKRQNIIDYHKDRFVMLDEQKLIDELYT